ncbi:MAG: hypothetical protein DI537_06855 [Stutzerimonas stutzeri]|nr:MAG: hypothetical protein DI537_06855 [Stutzerimonas stutzeri]
MPRAFGQPAYKRLPGQAHRPCRLPDKLQKSVEARGLALDHLVEGFRDRKRCSLKGPLRAQQYAGGVGFATCQHGPLVAPFLLLDGEPARLIERLGLIASLPIDE